METNTVITALSALAHEVRLALFRALVQAGPAGLAAGQIGERLGIAPSLLSFHLKELNRAGLIHAQRQGRHVIYSADYTFMSGLLGFLTENCCRDSACNPNPT